MINYSPFQHGGSAVPRISCHILRYGSSCSCLNLDFPIFLGLHDTKLGALLLSQPMQLGGVLLCHMASTYCTSLFAFLSEIYLVTKGTPTLKFGKRPLVKAGIRLCDLAMATVDRLTISSVDFVRLPL
ncbi:hypothetical protein VNO77_00815 [Canavalia gladiata]|uniref:Uncharacterized protein n=1 Tax=Canavalia gladiata TaxID=3824 RepID=A0AAN9MQ32_CANGL